MNDLPLSISSKYSDAPPRSHVPIGKLLLDIGKIAPDDLKRALDLQQRFDAPLGDIMISEGMIEKSDVLAALASQARAEGADLELHPPAPEMAGTIPVELCMRYGVVPWRQDGHALFVATSSPGRFAQLRIAMGLGASRLFPVIVDEAQIAAHQNRLYGSELAQLAAVRVPLAESCRGWSRQGRQRILWASILACAILCALYFARDWTITVFSLWAILTLIMTSALKVGALFLHLVSPLVATRPDTPNFRMPMVSVLVPLLKEKEIAQQLITRLGALTYPKSQLDVVLVLEENDTLTKETIARTELPSWIRVIQVPAADGLTTKPRALNYALDFCKGSIVGVWDAEDWPDPNQIEMVVTRFNSAPAEVVCLQGVLDYYNSRTSWITRCFTIEYAMWWRIVMPGIERMGLVVPLGGTTLFFRRSALEELGGWDAHNVTEDADLGVRLARHGYRTELLPTVTREEATSQMWPWVRQRSRWLKGFMVTYFVHMRDPRALIRDLGLWRFMGLQTIFLAAFSQFAAAPLLWSFWINLFGVTHPVENTLGTPVLLTLAALFCATEILSMLLCLVGSSGRGRRHLIPFIPTMMVYFSLGTLAAYKALWELVRAPFYWDKTQHGVSHNIDPPQQVVAARNRADQAPS